MATRLEYPPALLRLAALAPLDAAASHAVRAAIAEAHGIPTRRELQSEGSETGEPRLLLQGWAARVKLLADGRRQFLSLLLPGDVIGHAAQPRALAPSTIVALTPVSLCSAPPASASPRLAEAYATSLALEQAYLLAHIVRLGRLTAQERIGDLLLELHERLAPAGLAVNGSFELPLTQEMLAGALGLTAVHVNRMLQLARREGDLHWRAGRLTLVDPPALARKLGRAPVRVSAPAPTL